MQDCHNREKRDRHRDPRKIYELVFNFTSSHRSSLTMTPPRDADLQIYSLLNGNLIPLFLQNKSTMKDKDNKGLLFPRVCHNRRVPQRRLLELLRGPANDTWRSKPSSRKRRVRQRKHENELATELLIKFEDEEEAIDVNKGSTRPP
ncbi:hypothetical protein TSAR_000137 [Trichomalopsis sarcophagae]|uniref:Uncharacterized protein n=1 Tax=Trichomalopsis sarcophagae TaxID=543379 RepID=A0A232EPK5_9HYME|nr:hypothetical protein TSAR_000137 [Trichomalopsis sarcophagae]